MAVVSVPRVRGASASRPRTAPRPLLAAALIPAAMLLLGELQHMPAVTLYAGVAAALAALALAVGALWAPSVWLWATVLSFGGAAALRVYGLDSAGLLMALGILTLGHSGAFAAPPSSEPHPSPAAARGTAPRLSRAA